MLLGPHEFIQPSFNASNLLLQTAVLLTVSSVKQYTSVKLAMPFFNPKERLEVTIFFDGELVEPEVMCRIEDVHVKVRRGLDINSFLDDFVPHTLWSAIGRGILKALLRH